MNTSTQSTGDAPAHPTTQPIIPPAKQPMSPADAAKESATLFRELGMWLTQLAADNPQFAGAARVGKDLVAGANQIDPPPEPKPAEPPAEPQPDHTADHPAPPPVTPPPATPAASGARAH